MKTVVRVCFSIFGFSVVGVFMNEGAGDGG